jgi:hypothetical protein
MAAVGLDLAEHMHIGSAGPAWWRSHAAGMRADASGYNAWHEGSMTGMTDSQVAAVAEIGGIAMQNPCINAEV